MSFEPKISTNLFQVTVEASGREEAIEAAKEYAAGSDEVDGTEFRVMGVRRPHPDEPDLTYIHKVYLASRDRSIDKHSLADV